MSASKALLERSLRSVWHPCTQMKQHEHLPLVPIIRGEGVWLYDADGRRYLDGISSWWVNLFGHGHPAIKAAIESQLGQLSHVMLAGFTHPPVVALSEKLSALTGLGHAFYASDGASATEIALKMSVHYWRNRGLPHKHGFISLQNSYHGETLGALNVTDVPIFRQAYTDLLRPSVHMVSPDWRLAQAGESAEAYALRCAQALEQHLQSHHQQTAACIVEPLVQCAAGMAMYHPVYLREVRRLCDQYQIHLIADEIAVGFGRTGTLFACEQAAVRPDMLCLSKGITGGFLPLSVTLTTDTIYQAFYDDSTEKAFLHSHSYTGNPLACSAALATLELFEQQPVLARNRQKSQHLAHAMQALQEFPCVQHIRQTGMIAAFDVVSHIPTVGTKPMPDFAPRFYQKALARGLLLRPIGNTVYFMPPYVIFEDEIDWMVAEVVSILREF